MDLQTMRKQVFRYINYDDSSGDELASKDVNNTDVNQWINDRYRHDIVPEYADLRKEYFMRESYANNYAASGTCAADADTAGDNTITATAAIFTSDMIDGVVYNTTDSDSAKIVSYTSTTVITTDSDTSGWNSDSILVFTGIYTFEGDMDDCMRPDWVGVKYDDSDKDFTRCIIGEQRDLFEFRKGRSKNDLFQQNSPRYWFDTVTISSVPTSAIVIRPINWTESITNAIYIRYLEMPAELSNNTDEPRLPLGTHKALVLGATADAFSKLENPSMADRFEARYQEAKQRIMRYHIAERKQRSVNFMRQNRRFYIRNQ